MYANLNPPLTLLGRNHIQIINVTFYKPKSNKNKKNLNQSLINILYYNFLNLKIKIYTSIKFKLFKYTVKNYQIFLKFKNLLNIKLAQTKSININF